MKQEKHKNKGENQTKIYIFISLNKEIKTNKE
jgi:hypothetical protein